MNRRAVLAVTGSRADYGLMRPVFDSIAKSRDLSLQLLVTGMHLLPDFRDSLADVKSDAFGQIHIAPMLLAEEGGRAMAQSFSLATHGAAACLEEVCPDIVLVQGDRGEMLAATIAATHMNMPVVHMSGGDLTGTIDQSLRNAISMFAHIHLTTCNSSSLRLQTVRGEPAERIFQVGEPGLDAIRTMDFLPADTLASELNLDLSQPLVVATMHPVTTERDRSAAQMRQLLEALDALRVQTVFTYPNSDAGSHEMIAVLESFRDRDWIRIVPTLGSRRYLSLLRVASAVVGNSSSALLEGPSFRLPAVNIGTRQHGRERAANVIDVDNDRYQIQNSISRALDGNFRHSLSAVKNPYGDGYAADRTQRILSTVNLSPLLVSKWLPSDGSFVPEGWNEI